ncbi:hypothetical protein BE221DRAFT_17784 [Ostreococcus tauri]|nr:hypothetical protein BE221DRAFT_17784 [Ostreococcus tauri]
MKWLRRMSLRKRCVVEDAREAFDVVVSTRAEDGLAPDPRSRTASGVALGFRGVAAKSSSAAREDATFLHASHRIALGVGEGYEELGGTFPLECNFDALDAVSFSKGCYVGQENTARQRFRGAVRKRVAPVVLREGVGRERARELIGQSVVNERGDRVGEVIASVDGARALVRARVQFLRDALGDSDGVLRLRAGDHDATFTVPSWWPESYLASED